MAEQFTTVRLLGKVSGYEISFRLRDLRESNEEITEQRVGHIINSVIDANRSEYSDVFPHLTSTQYREYLREVIATLEKTGLRSSIQFPPPHRVPAPV